MLHDASDKSATVEALAPLIEALNEMGAEILPIDEDITLTKSPRQPTRSQEHLMQRWPDTFILTRVLQSTEPK